MTDKIIVSPTTRMASLSVYIDYDNAKPTGFYQLGDSVAVRVYATGDGLSNELVHVQEFSITNQNELSGKFALDNFVIPINTEKLTAFCVYGNRLDNGYPDNLDPEFCYDIEVEWKVTVLPKVTMDQWAYFNTKQLDQSSYVDIPEYNIPYYLSGTISPAIPFKIEAYIEKDINFYASTYTMPYPLTRDWVHPDTNGNWTVPLSPVIDGRFGGDLIDYLDSVQHARIVIKSITDDILHEQNIYYPTLFLDSGASSIPTPYGKINPIFDIGEFRESGVINVEKNFIILGRYMEYQYTSNYTYVEYSTPTDSVLIGAVGPTVGSEPTRYGMEWASVPKNRDYIDDHGDLVNMFNNNYTHNYAFRLNGILNGNKMSITRKYKFIHPADNISIELEMLPHTRYGSIIDNHVDPLYGNVTAAINNKIVTNKVFDVNDVAPTTGDTADYYISFLTDTYLGDGGGFQLPYIGSPTIGSQIVKDPYNKYTMGGIEYCSVPYYDSMETDTTEISIGRYPPSPKYIQLSFTLNTAQEYTSTFNYVVVKDYDYTGLTAPFLGGSILIVGTPSLGTINAIPAVPKITMDQWAYFNPSIVNANHPVITPPVVPMVLTGTISPAVPLTVEAYIEKDDNFASNLTIPDPLTCGVITPDINGNWEIALSSIQFDDGTDLVNLLKSTQHARIVVKSGDVAIEQNIYFPKLYLDSGTSSIPTFGDTGIVNPIFDIGGFKDFGPSAVINVEQNFIMLGRYMEYHYTSNYTFIEYSTPTDSVLLGAVGPTVGSVPTNYGMNWATIPKNRNYLDDKGNMVSEFCNDHTHNYAVRLDGILSGNTMSITKKYKFIHPSDNIELELEMLICDYGSIFDNNVDPFYGNVVAINNKVAQDRILDINDVSPTTGDTADYYISVLGENYSNPLCDSYQPWIGSPTLGSTIFKENQRYQLTTMGGIEYTGTPYYNTRANEIEITVGRFPPEPYHIHGASPLNLTTGYISEFNYVVTKGYKYPNTDDIKAPYMNGTVLIVGTPSLGTINAIPEVPEPVYTPGKMNQLSLRSMHLMGVSSNQADTIEQVGAWAYGWETTIEPTVDGWGNIKEVSGDVSFVASLTNSGSVNLAWKTTSGSVDAWINNHIISATTWTNIDHIAVNSSSIVGLKTDGTVMLASANAELSVSSWTDITQVKANGVIVGLKSDGTVVYTGTARNYANTADVDLSAVLTWTGITQIDVGPNYIVGVKADGTVVFTGEARNGISQCRNWTGIITIAAGDLHVVGGKSNGTVVAVGGANAIGELNVGSWTGVRRVYAGIQWSAGVKDDGTVVSTFDTTLLNNAGYDPNYTNVNSWKVPL